MEPLAFYISLGGALFALGTLGMIIRQNAIVLLMCIELMLNGAALTLVAFSRHFHDVDAQVCVFFVFAVAAAEAAVGLAIVLALFRSYRTLAVNSADTLKG